ncbi:MAG: aminotransferase class V-fold PLP-dependent enzyme [Pseudomonadota bacterium]
MLEAMDTLGNPSSVHAEGRAVKAIIEKARAQVASLLHPFCDPGEIVFTSGATEAAQRILARHWPRVLISAVEHDAVGGPSLAAGAEIVPVNERGLVPLAAFDSADGRAGIVLREGELLAIQAANSETGVLQNWFGVTEAAWDWGAHCLLDITQSAGKLREALPDIREPTFACFSAHKLGGPNGVGALYVSERRETNIVDTGGGQEQGRRSGTENVIGIAGFGAAAMAAKRDLEAGLWDNVEKLRNILEDGLEAAAPDLIIFGKDTPRLPNTSCFAVPGWKGETQVMQLDLAGFAVSAGSACSSGKVRESRVLRAMGFDSLTASSAIRVSLGPTTTEAEIRAFLTAWTGLYRKRARRAA